MNCVSFVYDTNVFIDVFWWFALLAVDIYGDGTQELVCGSLLYEKDVLFIYLFVSSPKTIKPYFMYTCFCVWQVRFDGCRGPNFGIIYDICFWTPCN